MPSHSRSSSTGVRPCLLPLQTHLFRPNELAAPALHQGHGLPQTLVQASLGLRLLLVFAPHTVRALQNHRQGIVCHCGAIDTEHRQLRQHTLVSLSRFLSLHLQGACRLGPAFNRFQQLIACIQPFQHRVGSEGLEQCLAPERFPTSIQPLALLDEPFLARMQLGHVVFLFGDGP